MLKKILCAILLTASLSNVWGQNIRLDSREVHDGAFSWAMQKAADVRDGGEKVSAAGYDADGWSPAVVPGTVLTSLVHNGVYPDPYHGINNKLESNLIPDITAVGRDFYTYWFRTEIDVPEDYKGKEAWLQVDGINYRAEVWFNSHLVSTINGMFLQDLINVTPFIRVGQKNALAVKVYPVDEPGSTMPKYWGAIGEWHNGGNGDIGLNTTMLMTVGWDFTYMDGIRDRNTGIWKSISLYTTGPVALRHPFVRSELDKPGYDRAHETISVEVYNPSIEMEPVKGSVTAEIPEAGISVTKEFAVIRGGQQTVTFDPKEFAQLTIDNPRLWWPLNKGSQELYTLKLTANVDGRESDSVQTTFGIREIVSDQNTPDGSRVFYVNGERLFIRGTNWIPEAMQRTDDARMAAELRYTAQSGVNLLRLWGGGIAESDLFYELCDRYGLLVWQEFWMTGDTRHPHDKGVYYSNVESVVKRIRNHPALAYYVASNESSEMPEMLSWINALDGTRGYQMQSECDGIHDGSPYKQVNPMQHYENTASDRGSRIDGFNPEYGAPTIPLAESLHRMMDDKDLWPINDEVWNYLDGNGFHLMTTLYRQMTDCYGASSSIEEFARKGQLVGAMNSKSIWEVWNENKLDYGDRFCSGLLFWYHNNPNPQVCGRMWDWYLVPTASLYHTMHSLEPIHIQFDYLKNTVSVVNDYYKAFSGYTATAQVYDIDSRRISSQSVKVDLPKDGVANDVIILSFPESISQVHFIYLTLKDEKGNEVSSNFYWRSKDKYEGKPSVTGPTTSGFESLAGMKKVQPRCTVAPAGDGKTVKVTLRNTSGRISFFNQLLLTDAQGQPVPAAFYTDNFVTLMPGQTKVITIDCASLQGTILHLRGWNLTREQSFAL